jgi:hypothetical protein
VKGLEDLDSFKTGFIPEEVFQNAALFQFLQDEVKKIKFLKHYAIW